MKKVTKRQVKCFPIWGEIYIVYIVYMCKLYVCVLTIYYCLTNYFKTQWLKTTKVYYLIVSVCVEFGNGLAGFFQLRVAHVFRVRMLAGAIISEDLTRAGGSPSKMAHSCGCWQEASVLHHMCHSIVLLECPHMAAATPPPPERMMRQREREGGKKGGKERERQ